MKKIKDTIEKLQIYQKNKKTQKISTAEIKKLF